MTRALRCLSAAALALALGSCGGGGGDGVSPPQVSSVVITAPAAAPTFGALGRTVQFAAQARDANDAAVGGVTLTWASSAPGVASVSGAGLVTAVGNGTATITAAAGGHVSPGVLVTVSQLGVTASLSPTSVTMGALGSTRQFTVTLKDSTGNALPSAAPVVWSVSNQGTIAVSGTGLVTALAVSVPGAADSVLALVGPAAIGVATPVIVIQVPAGIVLAVPGGDSVLRTTGRTRQFAATVRDSNGNALATQPALTWSSTATAVATVSGTGLVTAAGDGNATIQAGVGAVTATRVQLVQRYAATFTLAPGSAAIATAAGTQGFTATVQDTNGTVLPSSWVSRSTGVATVSPATGATTTATATGNGSTYIVVSGGLRSDSAGLAVSNQPSAPSAIAVSVGDIFFRSARNNTQNPAVDTLAVGGTVTWTWVGGVNHNVQSVGSPSFTSSTVKASGTYAVTFNAAGTYNYDCVIHGAAMSGTIVVR